ncbi:MAG TPA: AAA family ATPase, partial [Rubrivivax sp.]|nr:AAA family ATPase [Rubrivivax sp.]
MKSPPLAAPSRSPPTPVSALLEREQPLAALVQLCSTLKAGCATGSCVVLSGEAGVGKTSLLRAAAAAAGPGIDWLWGTCEPMFSPTPLGALVDWLDRMPPSLADAVRAGRQTGEVLAGVLAMLRHAAGPTVLVVDDAQWADSATLDLLRYVSRRIEGTRALLILSHRDDALASDHPLLGVLAGLPTSRALRIVLPPLTEEGVAELAGRAGRSAQGLYGVTQGNPFFVTELLAGAAQTSAAAPDAQSLPASVRDAVWARIAPLPPAARDVIEILSVSPTPLELAVLEAVLEDAPTAVALCTAAGLLLEGGSSLRFRHELARRAVEAALPPGRAAALHAAVFDALSVRGGAPLTRLVHHAAQAGLSGAVCQFAPDAARAAAQAGAHRQAAALYALALEHAATLSPTERAALHVAHSLECQHIQRTDDALVSRSAALALHRQLADRPAEGRDLYELALIQHYREGQAAALPLAQEAIDVLQRT